MVSLQYLKYAYDLSDEGVLELWVENPYWQHLSGMKFFEHQAPIEASSLSRWRTRLAKVGAEKLLEETLKAGFRMKLIQPRQLERINVDKQPKGKTAKRLWKWMKRRAVVEPGISHLKHGHRMNRNRLKGTQGDQLNEC